MPIISLKEKDAYIAELDTELSWRDKAKDYVREFAKTIGYEYEEVKWLAAYHEKLDDAINKKSDAGKQPHMHFMIWIDGGAVLNISKRYVKKQLLIERATNRTGRKTLQSFETTKSVLKEIIRQQTFKEPLSLGELNTLKRLDINPSIRLLTGRYDLYEALTSKLNNVLDAMLFDAQVKDIYSDWIDVRRTLTSAWGSQKEVDHYVNQAESDMRKIMLNSIIRSDIDWIDKVHIIEQSKGRLLELVKEGKFKRNITYDDSLSYIKTYARLLSTTGHELEDVIKQLTLMYKRSNLKYESEELVKIIITELTNTLKMYFS